MTKAEEVALAWALAESAAAFLDRDAYSLVCVKIGAGSADEAITELLVHHARSRTPLRIDVAAGVQTWIGGYYGSGLESALQNLAARVRIVPNPPAVPPAAPVPKRLIARRRIRRPD